MSPAPAAWPGFSQPLPPLRIGTSACLAGQRVRYDGTDKLQPALYACLAPHAALVPLCPEAALGIPRPPVRLVATAQGLRARGIDDPALDVTDSLLAFNAAQRPLLATLHGLVLKARSPSCGIGTAPQWQADGRAHPGDGLWAGFIAREYPWLPLLDEDGLQDAAGVQRFLQAARLVADVLAARDSGRLAACLAHHRRWLDCPGDSAECFLTAARRQLQAPA